ncbi:hypothetical protein F7725_028358 [Dissostichus mawsoni]|uniref:THAP domain-containing protein 1 n=1 Tax=Dissostichus mawsoni TaxID=36200 RepID=A0A7J5XFS7_DISMA|nr:hypothetical protein F7725_028358 [Dissostichus mawsoni]
MTGILSCYSDVTKSHLHRSEDGLGVHLIVTAAALVVEDLLRPDDFGHVWVVFIVSLYEDVLASFNDSDPGETLHTNGRIQGGLEIVKKRRRQFAVRHINRRIPWKVRRTGERGARRGPGHVNNYSEHCCVPLCKASAKFNGVLSFHGFPTKLELRRQWLIKIRRDNFTISSHSKVCSRHFATDQLIEPKTLDGRRRLVKGAVPTLFEWNHFTAQTQRASVWERRERPTEPVSREEQEEHNDVHDHDYCSTPEAASLDMSSQAAEDNSKTVEDLQKQLQELRVQREFCLQRFAGSDDNIRFYTRDSCFSQLTSSSFSMLPVGGFEREGPCKPLQRTPVHCEPHHCNMDKFSYNFIGVTVHLAYTCRSSSPPPRGIQRFPRHTGDPGLHRAEVSNTILTPPPK